MTGSPPKRRQSSSSPRPRAAYPATPSSQRSAPKTHKIPHDSCTERKAIRHGNLVRPFDSARGAVIAVQLVRECAVVDIIPRLPPHPAAPAPINTHQRHDVRLRYYRVVSQHDVERRVGGKGDAARRVQRG